jgi:peptide/nickel transport system substrate-binding protein
MDLAEGFSRHDGGKKIILDLKRDRFFSDGKQLTADDVLATFKLLNDPGSGYPYRSMFSCIQALEKMGDFRLAIGLKHKLATWKNLFLFKILNSREIRLPVSDRFRQHILSGTGPYRIKSLHEPSRIVLDRNSFDKTDGLYSSIEYVVVRSTQLEPLKLINGEIDICELQPENVEAYQKIAAWEKKFKILKYKKFGFTYLVFNLNNSALNADIRRIFYNLLVAGDFVDRFIRHRGEKIRTPFLPFNREEQPVPFTVPSLDKPVRLKILTNSESNLRKQFVLFLKKELQPENIYLEPLFLEYQTFLGYLKKKRFDLAVSGFILDIDYDLKDVFYHDAYFNYAGFEHQGMDELLDLGLRELNPLKRRQIYHRANRIWREQLPLIPLFNLYYYIGVSRRVPVPPGVCTLMASTSDFLNNIRKWKTR